MRAFALRVLLLFDSPLLLLLSHSIPFQQQQQPCQQQWRHFYSHNNNSNNDHDRGNNNPSSEPYLPTTMGHGQSASQSWRLDGVHQLKHSPKHTRTHNGTTRKPSSLAKKTVCDCVSLKRLKAKSANINYRNESAKSFPGSEPGNHMWLLEWQKLCESGGLEISACNRALKWMTQRGKIKKHAN